MNIYRIILLLLLTQQAKSQFSEPEMDKIADSLVRSGADTVLIYHPCICISPRYTDTSILESLCYIITKKPDLLTFERITVEYVSGRRFQTHNSISKKDINGIFPFIASNFKSIFTDTVRPALIKTNIDNKDTLTRSLSSHPCYAQLTIKTRSATYSNGIIDDDLHDGRYYDIDGILKWEFENINYEYNISTSIYKIISRLELITTSIEERFNAYPTKPEPSVIAYYMGNAQSLDSFQNIHKLTHIIYSFAYLNNNQLHLRTKEDTATLQKMVSLKKINPNLKVLIAFGGWGGCQTCSDVFSTKENRKAFARSIKQTTDFFQTDGIDLDWEFPALPSLPGHGYKPEDRHNFTALVKEIRGAIGNNKEISFAAGGFKWTLNNSYEWSEVLRFVDRIHLMSYDFAGKNTTGHHTALFSTAQQSSSADHFTQYLFDIGIPANKIVIGAAFYAKTWDSVASINNGLYQPGKPSSTIRFNMLENDVSLTAGYVKYWDSTANAPYMYNASLQRFVTYDNETSVAAKAKYVKEKGLNGIMFWQLAQDKYSGGLLDAILQALR